MVAQVQVVRLEQAERQALRAAVGQSHFLKIGLSLTPEDDRRKVRVGLADRPAQVERLVAQGYPAVPEPAALPGFLDQVGPLVLLGSRLPQRVNGLQAVLMR